MPIAAYIHRLNASHNELKKSHTNEIGDTRMMAVRSELRPQRSIKEGKDCEGLYVKSNESHRNNRSCEWPEESSAFENEEYTNDNVVVISTDDKQTEKSSHSKSCLRTAYQERRKVKIGKRSEL